MRHVYPVMPVIGDIRIRSGFLYLPRTMLNQCGFYEQRWWEQATWVEMYGPHRCKNGGYVNAWGDKEWR